MPPKMARQGGADNCPRVPDEGAKGARCAAGRSKATRERSGEEAEIAIDQGARLHSEGKPLLGQDRDEVFREKGAVFGRDLDPRRLAILDRAGRLKRADDEFVGDNRLRRHHRQAEQARRHVLSRWAEQVAALKVLREPDPPPVGRVHGDAIGWEVSQRGLQDGEPEHVERGRRRTRKRAA
jgi:hypothetical protein